MNILNVAALQTN